MDPTVTKPRLGAPTLAEDLLLLTGLAHTPAPAPALAPALAEAVLAELRLGEHVRMDPGRAGAVRVTAVADRPPPDDVLRLVWDYVAVMPRDVRAALTTIGPALHGPLLDRLVRRGDARRSGREAFLSDGGTRRRARLLADLREVLVDGVPPTPRLAALAGLLPGNGTGLPPGEQGLVDDLVQLGPA